MSVRHGVGDYPPRAGGELWETAQYADGETCATGRYPVVHVDDAWDLSDMLEPTIPGIRHHYREDGDGRRTAYMIHADGSWARASAVGDDLPIVHQGGPRRLWDAFDEIRRSWLVQGELSARGAWALVRPDGTVLLARAGWRATIS